MEEGVRRKLKVWNFSALAVILAIGVSLALAGCISGGDKPKIAARLNGAGATFPYPLYSKWIDEYRKVNPNITINYQSIGSGGGIKGITEKTLDFAASDAPMKDEQMKAASGEIFHIPTVMGAVVAAYNLEGVSSLKMNPDVVSGIFMGEIKKWNDSSLTKLNPGINLPDMDILVVHRSDGSGTTNIFTEYLSSINSTWKDKVGNGTAVQWPAGQGAKGNEGVSGTIKQTPGAVGYVELVYAVQNKLPYAHIQNKAGNFIEPTLESITAAAAGEAAKMPDDMRVSIVNADGPGSYPIAGYTYILVNKNQGDQIKGKALVNFLWWAIHDGETFARDLLYAPLPDSVVKLAEPRIKAIHYQGTPLLE